MAALTWQEFDRVEMRVGRVISVQDFPEARSPSYLLEIDFGEPIGRRQSSAAIQREYSKDELDGRLVVAVTNFPPKQIANHISEVLVLAAVDGDGQLRLLQPDDQVALGSRVR
ncbi:MAG: tRNA-binding protein [Anaerolineales bacterium]